MKKIHFLMLVLMLGALVANAQGIRVSAPSHVAVGENFRVSYTINTQNVDEFRAGNVPSGLEVIAGPYTSQQSSYQFVNGHTSSSSMITYTYTLYADKAGTYTIPAAHAKVGGRPVASQAVRITVSGSARRGAGGAPQMHDDDEPQASRPSSGRISAGDLFVKVSANKRRVHEQEPVLLTYKVYTLVDLTSLDGKMPDLTGFHTQEVPLPQQKSFHLEKLNGKNYRCVTWSQYVMFPQMTGKLSIPSITFKGIVVQQNRSVDPFEAFFNGGSGYVEVKRNIVAPGLDIQVDPLPAKPVGFSGGVGKFSISAQFTKPTVKEGDPLTLRVVVGGIGNLKLVKQPVVDFPKNFEKYDPKVTDQTKLTANGIEGNMVFDYLVVPRNQGEYTIPAVSLVYYDTQAEAYKTIKTQPLTIKVEKGDGQRSSVADYSDAKDTDIKSIKEGAAEYVDTKNIFFASISYWATILVSLLVFVAIVVVFRKRAIANADVVGTKGKRANKIATKRLKQAYKLMLKGSQGEFYDEVLRALWGYVGDRLNMPVEQLSREMIADTLASRGIMQDTIDKFITALDECEFERYAPGDPAGNMNKTYDSAMIAIMDIENSLKGSKRKSGVTAILVVLVALAFQFVAPLQASAITKANADAEFSKGNYQQAVADYEELLKKGESAQLYFNLGNSYYRLGNITQSVIAYERAQRLSPSDRDITYNLEFVRSKTIDKIVPVDEMFFVSWYWSLVNSCGVDGWARMAVVSFVLALAMALLFLLGRSEWMRRTGFYSALLLAFVFVMSNVFAWHQKQAFEHRDKAVVVDPTINVKSTPSDTGTDAFVIHEGTSVTITDRTMKDWFSVTLANGKEGWLKRSQVEVI